MVNFIDGLDGLAAGVCAISALTFSVVALSIDRTSMAVICAVLGGATFAFLRFNFHPASIFMGDAGSMLLGFVLGVISVQSLMKTAATVALVLPLLVLGVPFVDLFLIVFRRWRRRVPFYAAGAGPRAPRPGAHGRLLAAQERAAAVWVVSAAQRAGDRHDAGFDGRRSPSWASVPRSPPPTWRGCSATIAPRSATAARPPDAGTVCRRRGAGGRASGLSPGPRDRPRRQGDAVVHAG